MRDGWDGTRLLQRVIHALHASLDPDVTLEAILRAIGEAVEIRGGAMRLLNANADALEVIAANGLAQSDAGLLPVKPTGIYERALAGEVVQIAQAGVDQPEDGLHKAQLDQAARAGLLLVAPLGMPGRVLGSLDLYGAAGRLDAAEVDVLTAVAELAAVVLVHGRLSTSLLRIARALNSSLELRPMLDEVLAVTVMEMGLKAAVVRLLDASKKRLELAAAHGLSDHYLKKGAILVARSPIDQILLAGKPVALHHLGDEPGLQYPAEARVEGIRSVLAVPLRVKDGIIGVMRAYSARPQPFTHEGEEFLQSVADLVALAVENARLYQTLRTRYEDLKTDVSAWYQLLR